MRSWVCSCALFVLVGCGSSDSTGGTPDAAPALTDKQVCDTACAAQISCGLTVEATLCSASCQAGTGSYLACVRAAKSDCNALALCFFAVQCPSPPSGSSSCNTAAMCEGTCNVTTPTAACACGCIESMNPSKAIYFLVNNFCALARCPLVCTPGTAFDGAMCNECFLLSCGDENAQCLAN